MNRIIALVAAGTIAAGTLAMAGSGALAQTTPSASGLKGPPNADGYSKDNAAGSDMKSYADRGSTNDDSSAKNMKGPPNANGYSK